MQRVKSWLPNVPLLCLGLAASVHARVRAEINRLPENLRDTLLLASSGDLDYAAIAALMGVREGTVKSRVFEARAMLRQVLQEAAR